MVVLGAGFGGLELSTRLSEALGDGVDVTLIDKSDAFIFGFSKLDVMFGRQTADAVRLPYRDIVKPGVRFRQETIASIDPVATRVTTDGGTYDADVLVVALGADYDFGRDAGPRRGRQRVLLGRGRRAAARRAARVRDAATAIVGVCGAAVQVPARAERGGAHAARLSARRAACATPARSRWSCRSARRSRRRPRPRERCSRRFAERGIAFVADRRVTRARPGAQRRACSTTAASCPTTCSSAIPVHRAPAVVVAIAA